ncbi:MAG: DUF523 domain-containing protein [Anaerococcus hydrogenalis]|uniref:DUF523 domain-containing protein n=1 Tax=Anaerococcus hydrogenalis TaxID=33029 RepID=UPI002909C974|nr:DUF523 domain-containing protein [Anaerococcus hydrogenalis]MDU3687924.1 DUF523 domain-containing protein [Anaerococcus hydrogenalis]
MNVLISRCLLGINCRYDEKNNKIKNLREKFPKINFIDVCPEVDSGMKTPRKPCEIKNSKVINIDGEDFTKEFKKGSQIALDLCKKYNINIALLKAKSPSCGKDYIYDGNFNKNLINGDGITCQVLKKNGIIIFSEKEIEDFYSYISAK